MTTIRYRRGSDPLKVIRSKLEMTQQQLAAALGISTGQLGDYERGYTRSRPRRSVAIPRLVELAWEALLNLMSESTPRAEIAGSVSG